MLHRGARRRRVEGKGGGRWRLAIDVATTHQFFTVQITVSLLLLPRSARGISIRCWLQLLLRVILVLFLQAGNR